LIKLKKKKKSTESLENITGPMEIVKNARKQVKKLRILVWLKEEGLRGA